MSQVLPELQGNIFVFIRKDHLKAIENLEDEEEARKILVQDVTEYLKRRIELLADEECAEVKKKKDEEIALIKPAVEEMVNFLNFKAILKKFQTGSG